ncbi:MAG TPA: metallophosphoesterase, partial [Stellaceae bacterium]|nr:metallophosphoesterase [Stellaceae bacterium]
MNLWAISDLHLGIDVNRRAVERMAPRPEDWLILAGDIGDSAAELALAFEILAPRFAKLIWVPGNHELWTDPRAPDAPRGVERYEALVRLARGFDVSTPEDPYP